MLSTCSVGVATISAGFLLVFAYNGVIIVVNGEIYVEGAIYIVKV